MDCDQHGSAHGGEFETKAGWSSDSHATHDDVMRVFEAYKAANDERLATLEKRGASDPISNEKVARIDAALEAQMRRLDDMALKSARPALGHETRGVDRTAVREHKSAFEAYVRTAKAPRCAPSNRRRCRSAPIRTAVILCRRRSSRRSASA